MSGSIAIAMVEDRLECIILLSEVIKSRDRWNAFRNVNCLGKYGWEYFNSYGWKNIEWFLLWWGVIDLKC